MGDYSTLAMLGGLSNPNDSWSNLLAIPLTAPSPVQPSATTPARVIEAEDRFEKRLKRLEEILPITTGRVVPDDEDLMIGEARRLKLCVLFLDICRFSQIESGEDADQDSVLKLLNLFMAEMLHVLRASGGYFEKNTGDGLMAYFGEGTQSERTLRAVEAAVTMHHFNDHVISPRLKRLGLTEVRFRVGIETGLVTVANVGVRGDHHSLVAIGNTANVACKLMTLLPNGGIVMGHAARELLPYNWKGQTTELGGLPGFVFKGTGNPYTAWELKYRAPAPAPVLVDWASALTSLAGR